MSPARRATLLLVATTVLWGSSFFTMAWGIEGIARLCEREYAGGAV